MNIAQALIVSDILTFEMFDLEVGQGHGVQRSQWCHSIANIKFTIRNFYAFFIFSKIQTMRTKVTHRHIDTENEHAVVIGITAHLHKN